MIRRKSANTEWDSGEPEVGAGFPARRGGMRAGDPGAERDGGLHSGVPGLLR
jgi:hypothetical protein